MLPMSAIIEDPIYNAARKRRREWETIAKQVKNVKPSGARETKQALPANVKKFVPPKLESGEGKMADGDFHEHQVAAYCGLHAIHNLFRESKWPTVDEMNKTAEECAKESGDMVFNHKSFSGFWSMDTIIRVIKKHGYWIENMVDIKNSEGKNVYLWKHQYGTMNEMVVDDNVIGFIIHQPQHYTALRKSLKGDEWQYSNSYSKESHLMSPHEFCKQALEGVWNIYLVRKK